MDASGRAKSVLASIWIGKYQAAQSYSAIRTPNASKFAIATTNMSGLTIEYIRLVIKSFVSRGRRRDYKITVSKVSGVFYSRAFKSCCSAVDTKDFKVVMAEKNVGDLFYAFDFCRFLPAQTTNRADNGVYAIHVQCVSKFIREM